MELCGLASGWKGIKAVKFFYYVCSSIRRGGDDDMTLGCGL
jgi:hypothetical protein